MTEIKVESDVTGTTWKIVVTEGQAVEEGCQIAEGEVLFLMDV
jgi:biotin carboxyl carrier protein